MKRRNFLKKLPILIGPPLALGGVPVKLMSATAPLQRMAGQSDNDRVLVILQMHGGNDGLNALIPIEQYDLYYFRRANIAIPAKDSVRSLIPLDGTLPSADQVGLHPDMIAMKDLYDRGRARIIQGVSYENNNGSHFRGRDINFMGGGFEDYFSSGWVGRYLQQAYAPLVYPNDFPNEEMPDPLALELGSDVSLLFHQEGNIPSSISIGNDPVGFANLVDQLEGFEDEGIDPRGKPPTNLDDTPYGTELNWILGLEDKSEDYAGRLLEVYQRASETQVDYPEIYPFNAPTGSLSNRLTPQLKLVARLLDGGGAGQGVKTKVFLVKIGGFDTHAEQVESYDPTMGVHAALMYHITSAIRAFQSDLSARGLEDKVLTVTTSEFGRRIGSNGSFGTDHGTGGPVFLFGKGVRPGLSGTNPDLNQNNVEQQFDYRQVYASILEDWLEVDRSTINNDIFFGNFADGPNGQGGNYEPLRVASAEFVTGTREFVRERFYLEDCFPNPARNQTNISFYINGLSHVDLQLMDLRGRMVKKLLAESRTAGHHSIEVDLSGMKPGTYLYSLKAGLLQETKRLIVIN